MLTLTALALVPMMAFCALVVDIGVARQVRLQAQATADAAALAGAQELLDRSVTPATRKARVVDSVKEYARRNLGVEAADWVGCTDPSKPVDHVVVPDQTANHDGCISLDADLTRVRVRVPPRPRQLFFAQVLGAQPRWISAVATAHAASTRVGRVLPLTLTAEAGTGNLCVENSGDDTTCDARTSGNFGSFEAPRLVRFVTSQDQDTLRVNLAMGTDHEVVPYVSGLKVCDGEQRVPCQATNSVHRSANHLVADTGNQTNGPTQGFVEGFLGQIDASTSESQHFCGRLTRPDYTLENLYEARPFNCTRPAKPTMTVLGSTINGRHLAYWMTPEAQAAFYPSAEPSSQTVGHPAYATGDERLACYLAGSHPSTDPAVPDCSAVGLSSAPSTLFRPEIVTDPRFGWIPVIRSWPSGNSQAQPVDDVLAVYLYRVYTTSTKVKAVDAWVFDPGLVEGNLVAYDPAAVDSLAYLVE